MRPGRDLSVLWALRSPCNLGCDYCYFGTLDEHRVQPPRERGVLSHLPHGDLAVGDISAFLSTAARSRIGRVFLAGGEPLIWPHTGDVIAPLVEAGSEVVVCTNGIPLNRSAVRRMLIEHGTHAVSVSLDSADPRLNDEHRRPRHHDDGWHSVVSGIEALVADREHTPPGRRPRIGLYSVVTRLTLDGLVGTAQLAVDLGLDYFVAQPISLSPDHKLHTELALRPDDIPVLRERYAAIADLPLALPAPAFPQQVISTVRHELQTAHDCFGGSRLAFIQPDGSVWDCPSSHRIAATRDSAQHSIVGTTAADLFPAGPAPAACDCPLYSGDCVNMWPLVEDFDRFAHSGGSR